MKDTECSGLHRLSPLTTLIVFIIASWLIWVRQLSVQRLGGTRADLQASRRPGAWPQHGAKIGDRITE